MTHVTIHGRLGFEVRQLLAVIDILEEHQGIDVGNNEHRYAINRDRKNHCQVSFVTQLPAADLMAHFHRTGAARTSMKAGQLHLAYTAKADPLSSVTIGKEGFLPSIMEQSPF